jgi:XTP/dITP diphosphohydrolase
MIKKINVLTTNCEKLKEFIRILSPHVEIISREIDFFEPQTTDQYQIIKHKLDTAYAEIKEPVCVDDFGFYIKKYNNFPGALTKYIFKTIGYEGLLSLVEDGEEAFYKCVVGYKDDRGMEIFDGVIEGRIKKQLPASFNDKTPINSIFIPNKYNDTFANVHERDGFVSHRALALEKLKQFILSR